MSASTLVFATPHWMNERHHAIPIAIVIVLLLVLLLLLLLLRRGKGSKHEDGHVAPAGNSALEGVIEQRLGPTFERLRAEEQRLDEKQAALAEGEREFERTAEERIARLTEWEQTLAAREGQLEQQRVANEERYRARELELAGRAADLAAHEAGLVRRAMELDTRGQAAPRHSAASTAPPPAAAAPPFSPTPEPVPAPEPAPEPEPEVPREPAPVAALELPYAQEPPPEPEPRSEPDQHPPAPAQAPGRWNVLALDRLVEQRGREFPERVEEWTSYLYSLRAYAAPDGSLPSSFDSLIEETFRDLI